MVLCDSNTRLPLAQIPSILIGLGMLSISPVFAADVTSVSPANASHTAALDTAVSATLDGDVSASPSGSVVVHGSQTDLTGATPSISAAGNTVTLDPNSTNDPESRFHPGEQVQATATSGVETTNTLSPHVWQFRTRVTVGSGQFRESADDENRLGNFASTAVALG
ncbi:Ig-like domain-containing protein, partial [Pseudomonadota bacterium]